MLAAILVSTTVIAVADDRYRIPHTERAVLEGTCYEREIRLTEQRGTLTLDVDGNKHEIGATSFAKSYLTGSYLGRFTFACRRDGRGFSINFFGVEIPRNGVPKPSAGSVSYDASMSISNDTAIKDAEGMNLYEFNLRRNEYWLPSE